MIDKIHTIRGVFFRKPGLTAPTFRKFEVGGDGVYYLKNGVFIEYHINLPHYACKYYNENIGTFEAALNPLGALEVVFSGTHYPEVEAAAKKILLHDSMGGTMRIADGEYTVSYVQNGVNQIIGVRANSEEEAKQKFLAYKARKGYDAEFVGVSYGFESKPGFPVIDCDTLGNSIDKMHDAGFSGRWVRLKYSDVAGKSLKSEIARKYQETYREEVNIIRLSKNYSFGKGELEIQVYATSPYLSAQNADGFWAVVQCSEEQSKMLMDAEVSDAGSGYINLSYKVGNDYKGVLVRANSLSEATAKLHEKYPSAKVLGNYTATPEEVKHLTSMGTPMLDGAIEDGVVRPDGAKFGYHPTGIYSTNGKSYRGFEVTSGENGLRKGVYRFYGYIAPGKVLFGNSAVDGEFRQADFDRLIGEGKIRLLDEDIDLDETHAFGDDVVKSGSGWTNKGKEGTHGQFATKKEAAAQTRAMYANGYKGDSGAATVYAPIVDAFASQEVDREGNSIPVGAKVFIYRGKNSGKVGVVKSWEGNYAVVESGGSTARYVGNEDLIKDSASGLKKLFKVKDKKSGKTYAVSAKDSVEAVAKVSKCLKDATPHEVVVYTNQVLSEMGLNNSLGKYDSVVRRMRGLYGQSFATGDDLKAIIKKALPSVLQYLGFPV